MEYYYTTSPNINETEGRLIIDEYEFRHLVKVLRKKTGDKITVTDGLRNIYNCEIRKIDRDKMHCRILSKDFNLFEPDIDLTLCIAPLRNMSRYEFAMEKAVELGVNTIVPVITDFTILKNEFSRNKRDRIEKIIIAAMGQSQRCFKPLFEKCVKLNEFIKKFSDEKNKVVTGLNNVTNSQVFHSGTAFKNDEVVTNGGRVFAITSFGKTIEDAIAKSFASAETVNYEGKYYRSDIGKDLMNWGK